MSLASVRPGVTGSTVEVNGSGQLGVVLSSARYKRDIHDMGAASAGLMKLRPVSFRYKNDPSGTLQYGLVAEEVVRVYPELVVHGTDGKVQSVRYLEFTALLLKRIAKAGQGDTETRSAVADQGPAARCAAARARRAQATERQHQCAQRAARRA